jgi:hypothetical protein
MAFIRAYLDNVIASGAILNDLVDADERAATLQLVLDAQAGKFQAVTSDWARREMERTQTTGKEKGSWKALRTSIRSMRGQCFKDSTH